MQANEEDKKNDVEESSMIIEGSAVILERRRRQTKVPSGDVSGIDFEDMLQNEDADESLSEDDIDMLLDLELMRQGLLPSCSILLSDFGGQEDLPGTESMIDLGERNIEDEIQEPEDESMMEISEKSFIAEDMEQHLLADTVPMLF